jgi:hypothetical protein
LITVTGPGGNQGSQALFGFAWQRAVMTVAGAHGKTAAGYTAFAPVHPDPAISDPGD